MRLALGVLFATAVASLMSTAFLGPVPVSAGGPGPDLTVTGMLIELETGGSCAFTSTQLGVRVSVANNGAVGAGPFVVEVNGDQQAVSQGLTAGATVSLWFPGYQSGQNTAIADATDQVPESDEGNNQLTQQVPVPTLPLPCTPTTTATPTEPQAYTPTPATTVGPLEPTLTPTSSLSIRATQTPTSSTPSEATPAATVSALELPGTGGAGLGSADAPVWLISAVLAGGAVALIGLAAARYRRA